MLFKKTKKENPMNIIEKSTKFASISKHLLHLNCIPKCRYVFWSLNLESFNTTYKSCHTSNTKSTKIFINWVWIEATIELNILFCFWDSICKYVQQELSFCSGVPHISSKSFLGFSGQIRSCILEWAQLNLTRFEFKFDNTRLSL